MQESGFCRNMAILLCREIKEVFRYSERARKRDLQYYIVCLENLFIFTEMGFHLNKLC